MVKFVHTADWQLGMTRHFLAGEAQARFNGARVDVIRKIGRLAAEQGCGFVVVCGDVFESNQVSRQVVLRAFEAMAATPEVIFYVPTSNHDLLRFGARKICVPTGEQDLKTRTLKKKLRNRRVGRNARSREWPLNLLTGVDAAIALNSIICSGNEMACVLNEEDWSCVL